MCVLCAAACFLCAGQCFVRFVCLGTFGLGLCVIGWVFLRIKAFPCLGGGTRAEACQVWRFLRSPVVHLNRIFLSFLRSFFSINRSQTNVNSRSSLCPSVVPFSRCSRPCFFSRALSSLSRFFVLAVLFRCVMNEAPPRDELVEYLQAHNGMEVSAHPSQ